MPGAERGLGVCGVRPEKEDIGRSRRRADYRVDISTPRRLLDAHSRSMSVTRHGNQQQSGSSHVTDSDLLERNGLSTLVADGNYDPIDEEKGPKAIFSFSAVFAEVQVDPDLGLVRLNRFVWRFRRRPDHQSENGSKPGHRRRDLGRRTNRRHGRIPAAGRPATAWVATPAAARS